MGRIPVAKGAVTLVDTTVGVADTDVAGLFGLVDGIH
jgi:hypothetical protein